VYEYLREKREAFDRLAGLVGRIVIPRRQQQGAAAALSCLLMVNENWPDHPSTAGEEREARSQSHRGRATNGGHGEGSRQDQGSSAAASGHRRSGS
jgi:hypothetical protein